MIRTILVGITTFFTTVWYASRVVIARLLNRPHSEGSVYELAIQKWASAIVHVAGADVVLHGEENIPKGGAVFICNHVSWFDVFALASRLPRVTFVAKKELRKIVVFGWGAEAAGIVFIDRENRKSAFDSYREAASAVAEGRRIIVFPEGTRGEDYRLRQFKKGPFVLAVTAEAPIVPTVVYGAREIMGKGSFRIHSGRVHIHFLEPISTKGRNYDDRTAVMADTHARMDAVLQREYGVEPNKAAILPAE